MTPALGLHCTPKAVYFAVAEGTEVAASGPQRIEIPDGLRTGASVVSLVAEFRRRLAEIDVGQGALLAPQSYDGGPKAVTARAGAEALLRLAAAERGIEIEILNRATARTRLGIDRAGTLDEHVRRLFPAAVGKYWSEGRKYAAFAAIASGEGN